MRIFFSFQGWELIRKADWKDSSVMLMAENEKENNRNKESSCLNTTLTVHSISQVEEYIVMQFEL